MSDQANAEQSLQSATPMDEIPVDELIRLTRQFTRRIINQDRQRLAVDLRESGHQRSLQITAPVTLQQFFSGEIDLDSEMAQRFRNAPLLSYARFIPQPGQPLKRQATAIFSSQDDSTSLVIDAPFQPDTDEASLEFSFTLFSVLGFRFKLDSLITVERLRWLELMRREDGIAFLWTRDRWEQPYLIFVIRECFARVYAVSPHGYEAAVRLTPDMVTTLVDWLEDVWFPETRVIRARETRELAPAPLAQRDTQVHPPEDIPAAAAPPSPSPAAPEQQWDEPPTVPASPEEQWDDEPFDAGDAASDLSASDLEW